MSTPVPTSVPGGGRYDFEDGGTYCGGWEDGKAHGHGVCTGPKGQGEYCGQWAYGFEACGIYTWPSGNTFMGQWMQGKRHGLGVERKDKWIYKGEWTQGFKGRYGVRHSVTSGAKYEGTWTTGLQDGYGCETYADGGTYQGQWLRGCRHGYGVRQSVPYGLAAHYRAQTLRSSLTSLRSEDEDERIVKNRDKRIDETRGGFVLSGKSENTDHNFSILDKPRSLKRTLVNTLKLRKQRSTGDISEGAANRHHKFSSSMRSTRSFASQNSTLSVESGMTGTSKHTDMSDDQSFYSQDDITDVNVTECYMGEWKADKRCGFGVSERSDGLRYEGEWFNNKKYGYGATTFKDGAKEEGKYKNNILISSSHKSKLMVLQKSKIRERIDTAVNAAQRAAQLAMQKADIAVSRMANARAKAEQADNAAELAKQDSDVARLRAKEIDPSFHQPGTQILKKQQLRHETQEPELGTMRHLQYNPNLRSQSYIDRSSRNASPAPTPSQPMRNVSYQPGAITPDRSSKYDHKLNNGHAIGAYSPDERPRHPSTSSLSATTPTTPTIPQSIGTSERAYSTAPPKPKRMEGRASLSQLINPEVLSDHFDHYGAPSMAKNSYDNNHNLSRPSLNRTAAFDDSTDQGARRTPSPRLPSPASKDYKLLNTTSIPESPVRKAANSFLGSKPSSSRTTNLSRDDSYITSIENDVRKRLKDSSQPNKTQDDIALTSSAKKQQTRQNNLSQAISKQMGSLPDITSLEGLASMSKEDLMKLSAARREEIKRLLEEQEKRNAGDISVLASDVKKWLAQRQLMMFVVAVNATLASVVFNMMGG